MAERLDELYLQLRAPVYHFLLHLTGDPDEAEELTQETFLQALLSLPRFRGQSSMTTWLYSIARNVHRKAVTRERRRPPPAPAPPPGPSPAEAVERQDERQRLARALAALPPVYREALVLREFQELSYAQIGEILGGSDNWARVTCFRARRLLREAYLKDEGGHGP